MEHQNLAVIRDLEMRVNDLRVSTQELLWKLDRQENLDWPDMLNSYQALAAQYSSLMEMLRHTQADGKPELRALILVPTRLSLDIDPELTPQTEGRLQSWNHSNVPIYLRTRPDDAIQMSERKVEEAQMTKTADALTKYITQMSKLIDSLTTQLRDMNTNITKADHGIVTHNTTDTRKLLLAITTGEGLIEPQQPPQMMSDKTGQVK